MTRNLRTAGRHIGRTVKNAGRRYLEMMAKCDPYGYGYYGL
jgi:hypothetical protein